MIGRLASLIGLFAVLASIGETAGPLRYLLIGLALSLIVGLLATVLGALFRNLLDATRIEERVAYPARLMDAATLIEAADLDSSLGYAHEDFPAASPAPPAHALSRQYIWVIPQPSIEYAQSEES